MWRPTFSGGCIENLSLYVQVLDTPAIVRPFLGWLNECQRGWLSRCQHLCGPDIESRVRQGPRYTGRGPCTCARAATRVKHCPYWCAGTPHAHCRPRHPSPSVTCWQAAAAASRECSISTGISCDARFGQHQCNGIASCRGASVSARRTVVAVGRTIASTGDAGYAGPRYRCQATGHRGGSCLPDDAEL